MSQYRVSKFCIALALAALGAEFGGDRANAAQRGRTDVEEEVQVLCGTRRARPRHSTRRSGRIRRGSPRPILISKAEDASRRIQPSWSAM